jgi:hypothetical protein
LGCRNGDERQTNSPSVTLENDWSQNLNPDHLGIELMLPTIAWGMKEGGRRERQKRGGKGGKKGRGGKGRERPRRSLDG